MRRRAWILAIALVLVADAFVLAGVMYNRWGSPDAMVVLTERELPLAWVPEENTGISLRLDWNQWTEDEWLDSAKLEQLGFDCSVPVTAETAEFHYGKQLPRDGYVVLEQEGAAWQEWLEQQQAEIDEMSAQVERGEIREATLVRRREAFDQEKKSRSRLFAVDGGSDPRELRGRYPDTRRYIVAPAVFDIWVRRPWDAGTEAPKPPVLQGDVQKVLVDSIHVPRRHRGVFEELRKDDRQRRLPRDRPLDTFAPRYEVTLHFGTRHEPLIATVERVENRGPSETP